MEVANASMYDGSSAVPEASMMARRIMAGTKPLSPEPSIRSIAKYSLLIPSTRAQRLRRSATSRKPSSQSDDLVAKLDEEQRQSSSSLLTFFTRRRCGGDWRKSRRWARCWFTSSRKQFLLGFSNLRAMPISLPASCRVSRSPPVMAVHMPAFSQPRKVHSADSGRLVGKSNT